MFQYISDLFKSWCFKWKEWSAWLGEYDTVRTKTAQIDRDLFRGEAYDRLVEEIRHRYSSGRLSAEEIENAIRQGQMDASGFSWN